MQTIISTRNFIALMSVFVCCQPNLATSQETIKGPSTVLDTLDQGHPRLILKDKDLQSLKQQCTKDKVLQRYVKDVLKKADAFCQRPMLIYEKINGKMLHVSRRCLWRVYSLAFAWRWTGNDKYAQKAKQNLLTVCAFKDWNPAHFLDVAEMSHAVGIGYDWLYDYLDAETRQKIRTALVEHGLKAGIEAYHGRGASRGWWIKVEHNWNQVCNGGLLIGALAIADTDPEYADPIVSRAVAYLPDALWSYNPDGAWMEGPGYWHYATTYTAYSLSALNTALGKDFGLSRITGMSETGFFPIYMLGPTNEFFNYADCGRGGANWPMACMFWLTRTYNNPFFSDNEHTRLSNQKATPAHIIWYVPPSGKQHRPKDLDRYFRGPSEVAVFRSSWDDPQALFVAVKAGYNQANHSHLDLGSFVLDALGVRWACDLGGGSYRLPGYFKKMKNGLRWTYYRTRSISHNVPMLAGHDQDELAESKFVKFQTEDSSGSVVIDLTEAYKKSAKEATRTIAMVKNRKAVLVQDEFKIENPCDVVWSMMTEAEITLDGDNSAILTQDGKQLLVRVLSPERVELKVESAEQEPPQRPNNGYKRLVVRTRKSKGDVRISVLLLPVWENGKVIRAVEPKTLAVLSIN